MEISYSWERNATAGGSAIDASCEVFAGAMPARMTGTPQGSTLKINPRSQFASVGRSEQVNRLSRVWQAIYRNDDRAGWHSLSNFCKSACATHGMTAAKLTLRYPAHRANNIRNKARSAS
jgi:hypothetical protein